MRRPVIATIAMLGLWVLTLPLGVEAQVSPRDESVSLPTAVREAKRVDPSAYEFERALLSVRDRAQEARRLLNAAGADGELSILRAGAASVTGSYQVPVFAVSFDDTTSDPWNPALLEDQLFGPSSTSLTAFYDEISGGLVDVQGSVYGWTELSQDGAYYAGTSKGLTPGNAKVGELIRDTMLANDAAIDFGQFDNDGPDGIPNSGDDDGYVDFVAFVHPQSGSECGGGNEAIWSHRWRYTAWDASNGVPFITDDARAGGGSILVNDYVIQPGLACGDTQMIQIGVFCHEFGHAFGLPDLYDVNGGGGNGLGHWCLMASGNWNSPDSPAHMSAWTKRELGWVQTVDVDWTGTTLDIDPVATSGLVYRLPFTDDRWKRSADCRINGNSSLAVGLAPDESSARGWPAGLGYGNGWFETVARDFAFDGSTPVTLSYDYSVETEGGFDYAYVYIEVDGVESLLAVYDGNASGRASIDLTSHLGTSPESYRIKFRFRSDTAWSNEDGRYVCSCAPFVVDDVDVVGGGVDYAADFEDHVGGWFQPRNEVDNPTSEYWLVENRQVMGFDQGLYGEGLMVYHVDQEVMRSSLGNSGGAADNTTRGVVVEEADGLAQLVATTAGNRGDAGDPWTGVQGAFDAASTPATTSNDGTPTQIAISDIEVLGDVVRATFAAGDLAPAFSGVSPSIVPADTSLVVVELLGESSVQYGATVRLVRTGSPALDAASVEWVDHDRVRATFVTAENASGTYDVVVENPDGQTAVVADGFTYDGAVTATQDLPHRPGRTQLAQNFPNPFNPRTTIRFDLARTQEVELAVYDVRGRRIAVLAEGTWPVGYHEVNWDGTDASGAQVASGLYFARFVGEELRQTRKMLLSK